MVSVDTMSLLPGGVVCRLRFLVFVRTSSGVSNGVVSEEVSSFLSGLVKGVRGAGTCFDGPSGLINSGVVSDVASESIRESSQSLSSLVISLLSVSASLSDEHRIVSSERL